MKMGKTLSNQKGMATVETVLLLFLFVLFMGFATGFYGVIHAGILGSISARAYASEIFRNRANLTYHRNPSSGAPESLAQIGFRIHGIIKNGAGEDWKPQEVPISIVKDDIVAMGNNNKVDKATEGVPMPISINPVRIKTVYGICLDAKCGR